MPTPDGAPFASSVANWSEHLFGSPPLDGRADRRAANFRASAHRNAKSCLAPPASDPTDTDIRAKSLLRADRDDDTATDPAIDPALHAALRGLAARAVDEAVTQSRTEDPILGAFSPLTALGLSLMQRHGSVSANALALIVRTLGAGTFEVLEEERIPLTAAAEAVATANNARRLRGIDLPHDTGVSGSYRCDLVPVCEAVGWAALVEVKRGTGCGIKAKRVLDRLARARLCAVSHLRRRYRVARVEAVVVDLYGRGGTAGVLVRGDLDAFFGLDVARHLDAFDGAFRHAAADALARQLADLVPGGANVPDDGRAAGNGTAEADAKVDIELPGEANWLDVVTAEADAGSAPVGAGRLLAALRDRRSVPARRRS